MTAQRILDEHAIPHLEAIFCVDAACISACHQKEVGIANCLTSSRHLAAQQTQQEGYCFPASRAQNRQQQLTVTLLPSLVRGIFCIAGLQVMQWAGVAQ
jgi:hypothetical protein